MWRAFFFAVGTMLIILGIECLVVERFEVANSTRIPPFLAAMFNGQQSPTLGYPQANPQGFPPGYAQTGFVVPQSGSAFGPSRYDDQFQTSQSYYGGTPSALAGQLPSAQFSLAGFGSAPAQPGVAPLPQPSSVAAPRITRIIQPDDWIPWSLLAAGTLVVLYTNSTSRRGFTGE